MTANPLTQPLAVAQNGNIPAGWISPAEHEARERAAIALELEREQEEAAKAAREQGIAERLAQKRGVPADAAAE